MKILLVEDEIKALESLSFGMKEMGWTVSTARNGIEAKDHFHVYQFDVVVTDIMMPKMSGFELIEYIRMHNSKIPILALTALGDTENKVKGLDIGADDYLVKPFEFRELTARIRALHRRNSGINVLGVLKYSDLQLDMDTQIVKRNGSFIDLTPKELALIQYFLVNQERVIPKREIAEKVWDIDFDTKTNIIEVYVSYLRNKIDKPFDKQLIHTVHGQGYILKD